MRLNPFATTFLCAVCLFLPVFCRAQTVTQLRATNRGYLVVQVSINGSGPYSFLLDTGSNRTIVRNELLDTLRISPGRLVPANMATGVSYLRQTVVSSVAVAGLAVHDLAVEGIDAGQISRLGESVEGVLGEDFLKHFDLLIDNRAKTLTLDDASDLASSLAGDHLPLSFFGTRDGHATVDRVVFDLKLPSSGETAHFLIDSGTNYAMFFPSKPLPHQGRTATGGTLRTFAGTARCHADVVTLEIGKSTLPGVGLAFCQGMRSNVDVDGLLPTSTFARLFISHSGRYAIANPRFRKPSDRSPTLRLHSAVPDGTSQTF
jgi:Aspartyl protease